MIDLHTHSAASDGELTPKQLVLHAKDNNVTVLALTDHDTIDGLAEAEETAKNVGITFVRGIELNIETNRGEFHLLGLGLQKISPELNEIISMLKNGREVRNRTIVDKLIADGFDISYEELIQKHQGSCLGRPHFAEYFVEKKIVRNRQQAFDKFFGKGRPYYVDRQGAQLEDAILAIKASGGVPVLAHPLSLYISWGKMEQTLANLKTKGIEGIEAWHSGIRLVECQRLEALGRHLGFFITAGSDYHGKNIRADRKIGCTAGQTKIEDRFWTDELYPHLIKS